LKVPSAGKRKPAEPEPVAETPAGNLGKALERGEDFQPQDQKSGFERPLPAGLPADITPEEIAAIKSWLQREGTCLLVAPHHDVGFTDDFKQRQMEYKHHGDALVPRQQRFSQYTRSLMTALDIPVMNQWGLRPALVKGTRNIVPLTSFKDLDNLGLLNNVPTLNFHPHLPHYALTEDNGKTVQLLARQPIDPDRPHPFTAAGNTEFNCLLWLPPNEERAGDIVMVDSTNFTTLFGGTESLENFWKNIATAK